jgi:hypothetical protein
MPKEELCCAVINRALEIARRGPRNIYEATWALRVMDERICEVGAEHLTDTH